jgi:hypothetical protein
VPKVKDLQPQRVIILELPEIVAHELQSYAKQRHMTTSALIRRLISTKMPISIDLQFDPVKEASVADNYPIVGPAKTKKKIMQENHPPKSVDGEKHGRRQVIQ